MNAVDGTGEFSVILVRPKLNTTELVNYFDYLFLKFHAHFLMASLTSGYLGFEKESCIFLLTCNVLWRIFCSVSQPRAAPSRIIQSSTSATW